MCVQGLCSHVTVWLISSQAAAGPQQFTASTAGAAKALVLLARAVSRLCTCFGRACTAAVMQCFRQPFCVGPLVTDGVCCFLPGLLRVCVDCRKQRIMQRLGLAPVTVVTN